MAFSSLVDVLRRPLPALRLPSGSELPEPAAFLARDASVSLVVFRGEIEAPLHDWILHNGWRLVERAPLRAPFAELYARVCHQRKIGPKAWEVIKATYQVAGVTVLLDPEMVVLANEEGIMELCRRTSSIAIGAVWERVSRSVSIVELSSGGVIHRSSWCGGEQDPTRELAPWPHVTGTGTDDLVATLRASSFPVDAIFGRDLVATALLLAE